MNTFSKINQMFYEAMDKNFLGVETPIEREQTRDGDRDILSGGVESRHAVPQGESKRQRLAGNKRCDEAVRRQLVNPLSERLDSSGSNAPPAQNIPLSLDQVESACDYYDHFSGNPTRVEANTPKGQITTQ